MAYDGDEKQFTKVEPGDTRLLRRARELVAEGWCQRAFGKQISGKQHFCMSGGVMNANIELQLCGAAEREALHRLQALIPGRVGITYFNDAPGRTKEEVLAVFDKAIGE
jgi:hypothetical protein